MRTVAWKCLDKYKCFHFLNGVLRISLKEVIFILRIVTHTEKYCIHLE